MTKKEQLEYEFAIKKLLLNLELSVQITILERLGKKLRQKNSIEINKEVQAHAYKINRSV